jgi:hypothetical protein
MTTYKGSTGSAPLILNLGIKGGRPQPVWTFGEKKKSLRGLEPRIAQPLALDTIGSTGWPWGGGPQGVSEKCNKENIWTKLSDSTLHNEDNSKVYLAFSRIKWV